MIIFLYGKDTFRSRQQMRRMIEKFKADRDKSGINVSVLDALQSKPGAVLEQALSLPFLAEKRMIIIQNLLGSKDAETMSELARRIKDERLPESNIILFYEEDDSFKSKTAKELFEILQKEKYCQKFDLLTGVQLRSWVESEIRSRGGSAKSDAVAFLIAHIGNDMWRMNSILDQLVSYKENAVIEKADAEKFVEEKEDDNIFNLVDAIVDKNSKQAYLMIREQYKKGEDAQFVFAMLLRQFRILLELREIFDNDELKNSAEVAKKLNLHPFVVKKSLAPMKKYSFEELKKIYLMLLDLDIKTKTGIESQPLLLDIFVARVCSFQ
jgi:DNA polymerase-3 subunit delta